MKYTSGIRGLTDEQMFWEKVDKRSENECWNWLGAINQNGYGKIYRDYTAKSAHRISFEMHKGSILKGKNVLHTCDNRRCVNPNHLYLGTFKDNTKDMIDKGRGRAGRKPQLHSGEVWLMNKLLNNKISISTIAKIFDRSENVIYGIRSYGVYLCREGNYYAFQPTVK